MILQIILVLAALGAGAYFVRRTHDVRIRASKRIGFLVFILMNIYAVLRPEDTTWIANRIGVGRGTDLVVYLLVVAFVFGMLNTYLRQREISNQLTDLARTIALREAELTNRLTEAAPGRTRAGPAPRSPDDSGCESPPEAGSTR